MRYSYITLIGIRFSLFLQEAFPSHPARAGVRRNFANCGELPRGPGALLYIYCRSYDAIPHRNTGMKHPTRKSLEDTSENGTHSQATPVDIIYIYIKKGTITHMRHSCHQIQYAERIRPASGIQEFQPSLVPGAWPLVPGA